ncbi:MAG: hypothetical protein AAF736_18670, partial [Pseudomonadota bacterium]
MPVFEGTNACFRQQPKPLRPRPNDGVRAPYRSEAPLAPTDLWLAGNEGRPPESLEIAFEGIQLG